MKGWIAAREMDRGKGREGVWDRRKKDMGRINTVDTPTLYS